MNRIATITEEAGARLDLLATTLLGRADRGRLEALLAANPGLAAEGPVLPAGRTVVVPEIADAPVLLATVNPWE